MSPDTADADRGAPDPALLDGAGHRAPDPDRPGRDESGTDAHVIDWEDRARRAVADLDNLRKRQAGELQRAGTAERARVAAGWLPVLDNLELALAHADADPASIIEGVRAVRDQAVAILAGLGYARRAETGVPFDPSQHEVLTVVEDLDAPPGTVVQVLRPGYGDGGRQLRPVAVAVSRKPE